MAGGSHARGQTRAGRADRARALHERGGLEEASELIARARELCPSDPSVQALALAVAAEIDPQRSEFVSALQFARAAMAFLEGHHVVVEDAALVRFALVEALLACGHLDEARASLREALGWLTARADTFDEPGWRAAFLTQVPYNARIAALAERHGVRSPQLL